MNTLAAWRGDGGASAPAEAVKRASAWLLAGGGRPLSKSAARAGPSCLPGTVAGASFGAESACETAHVGALAARRGDGGASGAAEAVARASAWLLAGGWRPLSSSAA